MARGVERFAGGGTPPDEAIALLLKLTGQTHKVVAGQLADLLGYLPLALGQAGAYMRTSHRSLSWYVELFQTRSAELLRGGTASKDYPWTVATTWQLAFQQVEQESWAAAELLNLCAFFAPDNIPRDVLSAGALAAVRYVNIVGATAATVVHLLNRVAEGAIE